MMSPETQFWPSTLFSRVVSVRIINELLCLWLNVLLSVPELRYRFVSGQCLFACQLQIELRTTVNFSKGKTLGSTESRAHTILFRHVSTSCQADRDAAETLLIIMVSNVANPGGLASIQ